MDFLQVVEEIRAEEATVGRIFRGDGTRNPSRRGKGTPEYMAKLTEAATFIGQFMHGRVSSRTFMEVMSTSDFPILFGDVIDRTMLAEYREWPSTWQSIAQRKVVPDFRPVELEQPILGADSRLDRVKELSEYPEESLSEQPRLTLSVKKYGRRMAFSWETIINDDRERLRDIPQRYGRAARRSEEYFVTELYAGASGPHTSLYTAGNKNIINTTNGAATNNPALSIAGLQDAMLVLSRMKDEDDNPIFVEAVELVVPPALEIVAQNILNAIQLEITAASGGGQRDNGTIGEQRLIVANWMRNRVRLNVNPLLPLISSTANGNTSWYLFANPSANRPALVAGFLRGHEEPEVFIKSPNARRVGGGDIDPLEGDFDTDSIQYKVRHVLGGRRLDGKATVASNGTGS